jgi:hypothetical protein
MKPVRKQLLGPERCHFVEEDKKGGLKSVLGILLVGESPAADAPDHRRMPPHEGLERRAIPAADEALQQLAVGPFLSFPQQLGSAHLLQELDYGVGWHVLFSGGGVNHPLPYIYPFKAV